MRRLPVPFPLSFCLFAKAHPFGAGGAVFGPVGLRHKYCATLGAAFHLVPVFGDLGVQDRVQREDGGPKPPAQQRIGNALHTNTFFPIVQQGAVAVTIITALMRQSPGLAVLAVIHSRYAKKNKRTLLHPLNDHAWQSDTRGLIFLFMDSQGTVNGTFYDG